MSRHHLLLLLPLLATPLPAHASQEPAQAAVPQSETVVATFDDRPVRRGEFERWLLEERGELMANFYARGQLVRAHAAELGLEVDESRARQIVEGEIEERVSNAFAGDRDAWRAELALTRTTPEGYLQRRSREVEIDLYGKAIASVGRVVPEAKIVRDWQSRYGPQGVRAKVRALQLKIELVTPDGGWPLEERRAAAQRAQAEAMARIEALLADVRAGTTTFSEVAARHSDHESAKSGGMLDGYFEAVGWPAQLVDSVVQAEPGTITAPLAARGGVWVFQVASRIATPLEDVRDALEQDLIAKGPENDEVLAAVEPILSAAEVKSSPQLVAGQLDDLSVPAVFVNGVSTSMADYAAWLRRSFGEDLLMRYAERLRLDALGVELGFEPTPEAIDERVEANLAITIELQFKGDYDSWLDNLTTNDRTLESWRREARRRARLELIAEAEIKRTRTISEDEVRSLWLERYGFDGVRVNARMIALQVEYPEQLPDEPGRAYQRRADAAERAKMDELSEIALRIDDGEDFAALAEALSEDRESAVLGGVPPGGFRMEDWGQPVIEALLATPVGGLTQPLIEGPAAVLLEVTSREEVAFEDAADALRAEIETQRIPMVELASFRNVLTRDIAVRSLPALFQ